MPDIRIIIDDGADAYGLQGRNGTILHDIDADLAHRMVDSGHAVIVDTILKHTTTTPPTSSKTPKHQNTKKP
jgi:hypothetical protein